MVFIPFDITVESGQMAARHALAQVLRGLRGLDLNASDIAVVQLVLAEVVNNIVEHAYAEGRTGLIHLCCAPARDGLHLTVTDDGAAMPDGCAPDGHAQTVDVDVKDLPEGGFGWFLIRDLAKDVTYTRTAGLNRIALRLVFGAESPE